MNEENNSVDISKEDEEEYNLLVTRANSHRKQLNVKTSTPTANRKTNFLVKYLLCANHKKRLVDKNNRCTDCLVFPAQDALPNGKLPTGNQVLGYLFYTNYQDNGRQQNNIHNVAADLMYHWIKCNVYTVTHKNVKSKLEQMLNIYSNLKKIPMNKRGVSYSKNLQDFISKCDVLFDIKCTDVVRQRSQEKLWKVKQTDIEEEFYEKQSKSSQVIFDIL